MHWNLLYPTELQRARPSSHPPCLPCPSASGWASAKTRPRTDLTWNWRNTPLLTLLCRRPFQSRRTPAVHRMKWKGDFRQYRHWNCTPGQTGHRLHDDLSDDPEEIDLRTQRLNYGEHKYYSDRNGRRDKTYYPGGGLLPIPVAPAYPVTAGDIRGGGNYRFKARQNNTDENIDYF